MAKIIITEFMDEAAVGRLAAVHETLYDPKLVDEPDRLASLAAKADVLIVRNRTQVRGALLEASTSLKAVGRLGVGLDNIDVEACKARDVAVYPATGANDLSVAEYVITMAMMLLRGAYFASAEVAGGTWPRTKLIGRELSGRTLGLIGCGAIARLTATKAKALGMQVIGADPYVAENDPVWKLIERKPLKAILAEADVVSLHVPLTETTRNLIDGDAMRRMKPDAVLINAARGGVVDEKALAHLMREGHLAGAALDVFEDEPVNAETGTKFVGIPNLILTPHIAGVTEESNVRVSHLIADLILKHLDD